MNTVSFVQYFMLGEERGASVELPRSRSLLEKEDGPSGQCAKWTAPPKRTKKEKKKQPWPSSPLSPPSSSSSLVPALSVLVLLVTLWDTM